MGFRRCAKPKQGKFCKFLWFSQLQFEKNIEPIQRATVIVYHARERRPREERQIHSKRKIGQHVCCYVLFKTQKQWTRDPCTFIARANDRNLDEQHQHSSKKKKNEKNEKTEKTEESKIKTVQNSALSFTDRLTVRPDWFLSLLLDFLLR